jgi:hypothetical protein
MGEEMATPVCQSNGTRNVSVCRQRVNGPRMDCHLYHHRLHYLIPAPQKQPLWTTPVILRKAPTPNHRDARQPVRRPKDLYRKRAAASRAEAIRSRRVGAPVRQILRSGALGRSAHRNLLRARSISSDAAQVRCGSEAPDRERAAWSFLMARMQRLVLDNAAGQHVPSGGVARVVFAPATRGMSSPRSEVVVPWMIAVANPA